MPPRAACRSSAGPTRASRSGRCRRRTANAPPERIRSGASTTIARRTTIPTIASRPILSNAWRCWDGSTKAWRSARPTERLAPQDAQQRRLLGAQSRGRASARRARGGPRGRVEHAGMHVALAADRRRVAQEPRRLAHRRRHVGEAHRRLAPRELLRHEDASRPGAEILRRELPAGDLLQVFVHVRGADALRLAGIVQVLEELLAREIAAAAHHAREPRVLDADAMELAA